MKKLKLLLIILFPILAISVLFFFLSSAFNHKYNDSAVIEKVKNLNRWETASYSIEKIIDRGQSGNVFQRVLFGNRILLIAHGEAVGGFDFAKLTDESVKVEGKKITINFPPPEVLSISLNESETRVYDRQQGILVGSDNNLESEARVEAINAIREASCTGGILTTASENGRKQMTAVLSSLGFETITINIPGGNC